MKRKLRVLLSSVCVFSMILCSTAFADTTSTTVAVTNGGAATGNVTVNANANSSNGSYLNVHFYGTGTVAAGEKVCVVQTTTKENSGPRTDVTKSGTAAGNASVDEKNAFYPGGSSTHVNVTANGTAAAGEKVILSQTETNNGPQSKTEVYANVKNGGVASGNVNIDATKKEYNNSYSYTQVTADANGTVAAGDRVTLGKIETNNSSAVYANVKNGGVASGNVCINATKNASNKNGSSCTWVTANANGTVAAGDKVKLAQIEINKNGKYAIAVYAKVKDGGVATGNASINVIQAQSIKTPPFSAVVLNGNGTIAAGSIVNLLQTYIQNQCGSKEKVVVQIEEGGYAKGSFELYTDNPKQLISEIAKLVQIIWHGNPTGK